MPRINVGLLELARMEYHTIRRRRRQIERQRDDLAAEWEALGVRLHEIKAEVRRAVFGPPPPAVAPEE